MIDFTALGGDGDSLQDFTFQLGGLYGFTQIPSDIASRYKIPQHWYGMVQAFYPAKATRKMTMIEIQMLPSPDYPSVILPLKDLLRLADEDVIQINHFQMTHPLDQFNQRLKLVIQTTEEHIELFVSNPELLEDWKIQCLYSQVEFDQRVKATYDWLTAQTDWFDIDPTLVDWIFLVQELIRESDCPRSNDDDEDGGVPAEIL